MTSAEVDGESAAAKSRDETAAMQATKTTAYQSRKHRRQRDMNDKVDEKNAPIGIATDGDIALWFSYVLIILTEQKHSRDVVERPRLALNWYYTRSIG